MGGFLEVSDAVIVAEAFPRSQDGFFGGFGDGGDGGEGFEEFLEASIRGDGGDGGLLEHDLGN